MPDPRFPPQAEVARRITSLQNDAVKFIRTLDMRKARRLTNLFVAEGASVLLTACENGWQPQTLVLGPEAAGNAATRRLENWARAAGAETLDVAAPVLAKLAAKENPQSVIAVLKQRWIDPPDPAALKGKPLWLALESVRDPGNLGTIVRTADAAGVAGIILVGAPCDPYSREAVRASMGSIFAVPLVRQDAPEFACLCAGWPGDVVGTHLSGKTDFREAAYRAPVLLVMGSEGAGLSDATAAVCRLLVRIPMAGRLDSLNLAVATALMIYEIRRPDLKL